MASKYEGMRARMQERLTCSICLMYYNNMIRKPKSFPCQHSVCMECLQDLIDKHAEHGHFPCPMCREEVQVPSEGVEGFVTNLGLLSMVDVLEEDVREAAEEEQEEQVKQQYCANHAGMYFHSFQCLVIHTYA